MGANFALILDAMLYDSVFMNRHCHASCSGMVENFSATLLTEHKISVGFP
jgi:hypothetical protein